MADEKRIPIDYAPMVRRRVDRRFVLVLLAVALAVASVPFRHWLDRPKNEDWAVVAGLPSQQFDSRATQASARLPGAVPFSTCWMSPSCRRTNLQVDFSSHGTPA